MLNIRNFNEEFITKQDWTISDKTFDYIHQQNFTGGDTLN